MFAREKQSTPAAQSCVRDVLLERSKEMSWMKHVDWDKVDEQGGLDEETFWDAVAEDLDLDYSEVADRDPLEFM